MTAHPNVGVDGYKNAALVAGDNYTVGLSGGVYELAIRATAYGGAGGVVFSRIMPDGAGLVNIASFTADGSNVLFLGAGKFKITVNTGVTAGQIALGKVHS